MKQRIRVLKSVFLLSAAGLTVFLFLLTEGKDTQLVLEAPEVSSEDLPKRHHAATTMVAPRFFGEDQKNRHWEVTADRAIQSQENEKMSVSLENIQAHVIIEGGDILNLSADKGGFERKKHYLELSGDVFAEGFGYQLETSALLGDLEAQKFSTTSEVSLTSEGFNLNSGSLDILKGGYVAHFKENIQGRSPRGTLSAKEMWVYRAKNYALLSGDAKISLKTEALDVGADFLKIHYNEITGLETVVAESHVTVVHGETTALAEEAEYLPSEKVVILQGDVKITKNGNLITGDKVVYNIQTGNTKLHQRSRSELGDKAQRVRARFLLD